MEYVLEAKDICKKYGKGQVLNKLNIHIKKGDIYGLIGRNGAGKTTLIRVICGLQYPSSGSYSIYGIEYKDKAILNARKRMNAIVEAPAIYMNLSAKDNLIAHYKLVGNPNYEEIANLLELVGLEKTGGKKAKNFSLGMRQRLGIAICLAGNPDFIILDEPTNGLDPEGIIDMRELILKLNQERGITFLISSHYLDELSKIATCYGFIENGRMIKEIEAEKLEEQKSKKTILKATNTKKIMEYFEKKGIHYDTLDEETLVIYEAIDINEIIHKVKDIKIKELKEVEESLENFYLNLLGDKHD